MVVIVRPNGESFPASLTPIPGRILVDMSDVFVQTTLAWVCTGTAWAHEALDNVFSPGAIGQRVGVMVFGVLTRRTKFSALIWFGERIVFSSHTSSALSAWQGWHRDHRATTDHRATNRATRDHLQKTRNIYLKRGCIEFKYYADGIHSGLTPPGNNSWPAGLTKGELSPSVCTPPSLSLFAPHQILYRASLSSIVSYLHLHLFL